MNLKRLLLYSILIALSTIWLIPLSSVILATLKSNAEVASRPFWDPPEKFLLFQNIQDAWINARLKDYFFNSIVYASTSAFFAVLIASLAAFAIARLRFKGSNFFFYLFMLGTFFPFQMYLVPFNKLFIELGLYDTKLGLILVYTTIAIPFALFLMRNYFVTIHSDLMDAAKIDGVSDFGIYWRIFLPLSLPAFSAAIIFQFVWIWNDLLFGLVLTTSTDARPIMTGLAMLSGKYGMQWATLSAGALTASIPTIILYMGLQKYFVRGILSGAVKM